MISEEVTTYARALVRGAAVHRDRLYVKKRSIKRYGDNESRQMRIAHLMENQFDILKCEKICPYCYPHLIQHDLDLEKARVIVNEYARSLAKKASLVSLKEKRVNAKIFPVVGSFSQKDLEEAIVEAIREECEVCVAVCQIRLADGIKEGDEKKSFINFTNIAKEALEEVFRPLPITCIKNTQHNYIWRVFSRKPSGRTAMRLMMRPIYWRAFQVLREIYDSGKWVIGGSFNDNVEEYIPPKKHVPIYAIQNNEVNHNYYVIDRTVLVDPQNMNLSFKDFAKLWMRGGWSLEQHVNAGLYGFDVPPQRPLPIDRLGFVAVAVATMQDGETDPTIHYLSDIPKDWPLRP